MGVQGTGGVGGGIPRGRQSHVAYYVALVAILGLLVLLLMYFFYFFVRKIKKLSRVETLTQPVTSCRPPPATAAYPVQPEVRETASEMAKLCKQMPPPGKGGTVFPTSTSPAAIRTDTGEAPHSETGVPGPAAPGIPNAPTVPSAPTLTVPGAPISPGATIDAVLQKPAPPAVEPIESVAVH